MVVGICLTVVGAFGIYATKHRWVGLNGELYGKNPETDEADAQIVSYAVGLLGILLGISVLIVDLAVIF